MVVSVLADVASAVAAITGVLSLFLGWVPVLGQVLVAASLLATLVAFACHLSLAAMGHGDTMDLVWDVVSLATFGIGGAMAGAGRYASICARGRAWTVAKGLAAGAGNSGQRYRAARALLGTTVRGAHRTPFSLRGLRSATTTGFRDGYPLMEGIGAVRQLRQAAPALRTFSLSAFPSHLHTALTGSDEALRALRGMDAALQSAPEVARLRHLAHLSYATGGLVQVLSTGHDSWVSGGDMRGRLDRAVTSLQGVGIAPSSPGLPAGFTAPSTHPAPLPAQP